MKTIRLLSLVLLGTSAWARQDPALRQTTQSNLENIVAGTLIFISDNRGVLATSPSRMKTMLTPYFLNGSVWTAPGDPPGTMSFELNPLLVGKMIKGVAHPETLVLFYQGKGRDLYYQKGRCAIGYADGSVKLITPKESAKLRWKP